MVLIRFLNFFQKAISSSHLDFPVVSVEGVSDEAKLLVEGAADRAGVVEGSAGRD